MVVGSSYYSSEMAFDRMLRQHRREIPNGFDLESAFEKWVSLSIKDLDLYKTVYDIYM